MITQFGGLKLKDSRKTGFISIIDMVNKPRCDLNLLTYKSLKGFMITLDIPKNDSEYLGLKNYTTFTVPIESFILKFVVITIGNNKKLSMYKGVKKSSETENSFYEEAKLQQDIWKNSILGARPEICPPVANFFIFYNDNAKNVCDFFENKNGVFSTI